MRLFPTNNVPVRTDTLYPLFSHSTFDLLNFPLTSLQNQDITIIFRIKGTYSQKTGETK